MQITISGARTSGDNWLAAHQLPAADLPCLNEEELKYARSLGLSTEEYARSRYAQELTEPELTQKAETVGRLVAKWLARMHSSAVVTRVGLDTLAGKFRVDVQDGSHTSVVHIAEQVIDDLLENGSRDAEAAVDRLLATNLWFVQEAKAS